MEAKQSEKEAWWGERELAVGSAACWKVGPSTVWLARMEQEWRVSWFQDADRFASASRLSILESIEPMKAFEEERQESLEIRRFSARETDAAVKAIPVLADRSMVVRPETPLYVLPDEEATLFISTPLWIKLDVGKPGRTLIDAPLYRPSDTWFGASTTEGELCYENSTAARLKLDELIVRPYRAITAVRVRNLATDTLWLDRFQLLVPSLSLHVAAGGALWTESVTVERKKAGEMAVMQRNRHLHPEAGKNKLLSGPRRELQEHFIFRAFGSLFRP